MSANPPSVPPPVAERVSFESLVWVIGCVALAMAPLVPTLPPWLTLTVIGAAALRLISARRQRREPPAWLRYAVSLAAIALLLVRFRTFNGLTAGSALLALLAGLKLLETRSRRDVQVVTMIIYFLGLAALLDAQSFWLLAYLIVMSWVTSTTLLRIMRGTPVAEWNGSARRTARMLVQALPLALVFWLLFPRFASPLWQTHTDRSEATSGLGDTMTPGDITDLALSDEIAFRVRFHGAAPPPSDRYWRGPVLHDFDGRSWRHTAATALRRDAPTGIGPEVRYTLSLEPHHHTWVFALDRPTRSDLIAGYLNADRTLMRTTPVDTPLDVEGVSQARLASTDPLDEGARARDTRLPPMRNPRTLELSRSLRAEHPDDAGYADAVLALIHDQPFYYTLQPPALGADSVDEFLFDSRRGFCGHYASAFATLMRAAAIPARIITGYHGGTYNRFADYWILRQSDAHAWVEIWLAARGWVRIDPTAYIAPSRVEIGLADGMTDDGTALSRWQQRKPWFADVRLRLDALRLLWRERILRFDQSAQQRMLARLHIPDPDGQKLALLLAAWMSIAMLWLTFSVRRELRVPLKDPVVRAYARLGAKLAAVGLPRRAHESAMNYALRVSVARPDLGERVTALCATYTSLRYGAEPSPAGAADFVAAVGAFHARTC